MKKKWGRERVNKGKIKKEDGECREKEKRKGKMPALTSRKALILQLHSWQHTIDSLFLSNTERGLGVL